MGNTANIAIGACQITYKGVDLGHTLDGVEFTLEREFVDLVVDMYGSTPVDKALTGQKVKVKFKLAEITGSNLGVAVPEGSNTGNDQMTFGNEAGYLLSQDAGLLQIRPLKNVEDAIDDDDILIYKAISTETLTMNYKVDEQRVIEVTMEGLVDTTLDMDGELLGKFGGVS